MKVPFFLFWQLLLCDLWKAAWLRCFLVSSFIHWEYWVWFLSALVLDCYIRRTLEHDVIAKSWKETFVFLKSIGQTFKLQYDTRKSIKYGDPWKRCTMTQVNCDRDSSERWKWWTAKGVGSVQNRGWEAGNPWREWGCRWRVPQGLELTRQGWQQQMWLIQSNVAWMKIWTLIPSVSALLARLKFISPRFSTASLVSVK